MPFERPTAFVFIILLVVPVISVASNTSYLPGATPQETSREAWQTDDDLEIVRKRVIDDLLAPPVSREAVSMLVSTIRGDGSWPGIDYDDLSRTGFQHSIHLQNMFQLGRAFMKPESPFFHDEKVKKSALAALDFWLRNDFICDNWWWNEMGTPHIMINTLLVLDTELSDTQSIEGLRIAGRANLEASGARPGGDLIKIAGMLTKQALFRRDRTVMHRVASVMADEIRINAGRGMQADMSFHHRVDKVISTLSYGLGYAESFSYWAVKFAGTRYQFPGEAVRLLTDYFLDGICKSMVHGKFADPGAKNRDLSRKGALNPQAPGMAENLLQVSKYRKAELEEIARIRRGEKDPTLSWNRFFWRSEYFTHQRPGYFASVRMHSSRNHTAEQPHNEEGLKMHHLGDGANFISLRGTEYHDIFPVWDWQKIPGTTVVQKPEHPHWHHIARQGLTDFVGGVSNGLYGAAAFDFKSAHDPLTARKAWFFFDDEIICLGADISSDAPHTVATTLNQCLLNGEVTVRSRKALSTPEEGDHSFEKVSWIWHDGVGYVFPSDQNVHLSNAMATGKWREINHQASASDELVKHKRFTLWLDHGVKPDGATYAYIILPGTARNAMENYVEKPTVEILSNAADIQAVTHLQTNRSQLVFYQPGKIKIPENITISADSPCMAIVKTNGKTIEQITVSDPARALSNLRLRTSAVVEGTGPGWEAVWNKKDKESIIDIALPQEIYAGQSVDIRLHGL